MNYNLAQINITSMKYDLNSPEMKDFVDNLDIVNTNAENSPGFVWRMKDEYGANTSLRVFGHKILVNISMWEDVQSLRRFIASPLHASIMKRKKEWFDGVNGSHLALWWSEDGIFPTAEEAKKRLNYINQNGPTPYCFNFKETYPKPEKKVALS